MDEVENLKKEIVDATTQAAVKRVEEESEKLKASFHSELQAFADSIEKDLTVVLEELMHRIGKKWMSLSVHISQRKSAIRK